MSFLNKPENTIENGSENELSTERVIEDFEKDLELSRVYTSKELNDTLEIGVRLENDLLDSDGSDKDPSYEENVEAYCDDSDKDPNYEDNDEAYSESDDCMIVRSARTKRADQNKGMKRTIKEAMNEIKNLKKQKQPSGSSKTSQIIKKKEKKSLVWKYFSHVKNGDGSENRTKVVCRLCQVELKFFANTTNMMYHLRAKHLKDTNDPELTKQPTISKYIHTPAAWKRNGNKSMEMDCKLAKFVISANLSLRIVGNEWLKQIVMPGYQLPGYTFLAKNVLEPMMEETQEILKARLQNAPAVGIQLDHYTSVSKYPYANVYATFINSDFEMENLNMGTFLFKESHTAYNIFESLEGLGEETQAYLLEHENTSRKEGILIKWNIADMPRAYTTDNVSACKCAFEDKEEFGWVGCFAHRINLLVKKGLAVNEVSNIIKRMKTVTTFINKSTKAHILLKENEEWLGFPDLELLTECPTRWNSFFLSACRMDTLKNTIDVTLLELGRTDLLISYKDWTLVQDLIKLMKPFNDATNLVSANKYPTINYIKRTCDKFKELIDPEKELPFHVNNSIIMKKVRKAMHDYKEFNYKESTQNIIDVAALLDPRVLLIKTYNKNTQYKQKLIQRTIITAKHKQTRHEAATQSEIPCTQGQEYSNISGPLNFSLISPNAASPQSKKSTPKAKDTESTFCESLYSDIYEEVEVEDYPVADLDTLEVKINQEIDAYYRYISDNRKEICEQNTAKTFDVLAWWKEKQYLFPTLALTARSILCITATSCNCERAFSSASNINTSKRNRLTGKSVNMLTFLHDNFAYIPDNTKVTDISIERLEKEYIF